MESDRELAGRSAAGDRMAYRDLVERYGGLLFGYCHYLTRDREDARKLARETFVRGFTDPPAEVEGAWIDFLTRLASRLHRQGRVRSSSIVEEGRAEAEDDPGLSDPVRFAIAEDLFAIDSLDRIALALRHGRDYSADQIGEALGESGAVVSSRLSRGFKSLRDLLLARVRSGGLSVGV